MRGRFCLKKVKSPRTKKTKKLDPLFKGNFFIVLGIGTFIRLWQVTSPRNTLYKVIYNI